MKQLMYQATELWNQQVAGWPLAARFYSSLKEVKTREFVYDFTRILVQFNPARIGSTAAKTDAASIAVRPCFLCAANRPAEQREVDAGDFLILVNPFPIFPQHFTLPHKEHIPQQILPYYRDFLHFAAELTDCVVFYNGPECGASAPDHLHFQAGNKEFLPLIADYHRWKDSRAILQKQIPGATLTQFSGALRKILIIEAETIDASVQLFEEVYAGLRTDLTKEPMMNVLCLSENEKWITFVLPRSAFRPTQYYASPDEQLLISPAAIEMAGVLITPVEEHFNKINGEQITDIYSQISPDSL